MPTLSLRTLEVSPTLAVSTSRDDAPLPWSAHADARLRAWRDGTVVREIALDHPVLGFDVGHGMVASWDERSVTLRVWPIEGLRLGAPLARWQLAGRCVRALCVGAREVEIYTVETDGPPYDRCGHRFRTKVGEPLGSALATAWGEAPPFGALGIQPQSSTAESVVYGGPDGAIVLRDPYGTPSVLASPRGRQATTFTIEGARPIGAKFVPRSVRTDVILWELDRLWWCEGDARATVTRASTPVAISDVLDVAASGSSALVRGHRGLGWLAHGDSDR